MRLFLNCVVTLSLVTFVAGGALAQNPLGNNPLHRCDLPFKIMWDGGALNGCTNIEAVLQQAIAVWNAAPPPHYPQLFVYAGQTSSMATICEDYTPSDPQPTYTNLINEVAVKVLSGSAGRMCHYNTPGTNDSEKDVVLSSQSMWDCSGDPAEEEWDVLNILVHELGHVLGLEHPGPGDPCLDTIMHLQIPGTVFLGLGQCDIDMIKKNYNPDRTSSQILGINNLTVALTFDPGTAKWDANFSFDTNLSATSDILYDQTTSGCPFSYGEAVTGPEAILHDVTVAGLDPSVSGSPTNVFCYELSTQASSIESGCLPQISDAITLGEMPVTLTAFGRGAGEMYALADSFALGCPQGDFEDIVILIDFDDSTPSRDIGPGELTIGQPINGNVALYWSTPPPADSAATSANGFVTTITVGAFGGCGEDEVPVLLNGIEIGRATITVKSPDVVISGGSAGQVDLVDWTAFADTWLKCSPDPAYNTCLDFFEEPGHCVNLVDWTPFGSHWLHQFGGGGAMVSGQLLNSMRQSLNDGGDTPAVTHNHLAQNSPNPFNPVTAIEYSVKNEAHVTLSIYDVRGELVRTLVDEVKRPGAVYRARWAGSDNSGNPVASGLYFYRIVAGEFVQTKKMLLLK